MEKALKYIQEVIEAQEAIDKFKAEIEAKKTESNRLIEENEKEFDFERDSKIPLLKTAIKNAEQSLLNKEYYLSNTLKSQSRQTNIERAYVKHAKQELLNDKELNKLTDKIIVKANELAEIHDEYFKMIDSKIIKIGQEFNDNGYRQAFKTNINLYNSSRIGTPLITSPFLHDTLKAIKIDPEYK